MLAFLAPALCAAQTRIAALERLAAESSERALDLFPVNEIFGRGAGPRQDRYEDPLTEEHRERQRALHKWILGELDGIPAGDLSPTEKLTHGLLGWRARNSLEWLAQPFYQHSTFTHLDGGARLRSGAGGGHAAVPQRSRLPGVAQAAFADGRVFRQRAARDARRRRDPASPRRA